MRRFGEIIDDATDIPKALGIQQKDLSEALGVSKSYISMALSPNSQAKSPLRCIRELRRRICNECFIPLALIRGYNPAEAHECSVFGIEGSGITEEDLAEAQAYIEYWRKVLSKRKASRV